MTAPDDDIEGARGGKLADDAGSDTVVPPDPDDLAADSLRGDGLADDADPAAPPDVAAAAEGGIRGDGLATDA